MLKTTLTVLAAATLLVPAALAEGKNVTLTHSYDVEALSDDLGAAKLLIDLKRAAERVCTTRVPAYGGMFTDEACAESLFEAAVQQIHQTGMASGVNFAPAFERAALTQIASAN